MTAFTWRSHGSATIPSRKASAMPIRLVLAGPHRLILDALAALLREAGGIEVLAYCHDGEEAIAAVHRHNADLLLAELRMPRVDGLEVARQLAAAHLKTPLVLLADRLDEREAL